MNGASVTVSGLVLAFYSIWVTGVAEVPHAVPGFGGIVQEAFRRQQRGGIDDEGLLVLVEQTLADVQHDDVVALRFFGEDKGEFAAGVVLGVGTLASVGF